MTILQKIYAWLKPAPYEPEARADVSVRPPSTHARHIAEVIAQVRQCSAVEALGADIGHYNGHVREAALKRAAELRAPDLLPAVVARLNDWVPRVRRRAQDLVLDWLPTLDADAALGLLGAVQRLRAAGRADHSAWLHAVERMVVAQVGAERIVAEIASPDTTIARACFRLVEELGLADVATRVRHGLVPGTDIVLARKAADALVRLDAADRDELGRLALRSHFGIVRAVALRCLLSDGADGTDGRATLAIRMLADPNGWVRLIASAWLERRGVDSAPLYAARLTASESSITVLRACLMGLAETGKREYVGLVRELTSHASPRVRINAFAAWLQLAPDDKDAIARRVLSDGSRRVRKLVLSLHRKHGAFVAVDDALALLRAQGDVDLMLRYAQHYPWSLLLLIAALEPDARADPALRERLRHELIGWINGVRSGYARPTAAQHALFARPDTQANLLALLGRDPKRTAALAFEFRVL